MSINANVKGINIPSEEHRIDMYPMDLEEFLWALGDEMMMDYVRDCYANRKPLGQSLHRKMMDYLRLYMIIGGMPQAVAEWVETQDFDEVDRTKRNILALYRSDISKYANGQEAKVTKIFDTLPSQLQNHERKFKLSSLGQGTRSRSVETAFYWLEESRVVNTGMLVENLVSQMLRASGHKLYFFSSYSKTDAEDRMEIDFLVPKPLISSRHNIHPIEVKSASRYTLTSLTRFSAKYSPSVAEPIVLHPSDLKVDSGIIYLPLYMTPLL